MDYLQNGYEEKKPLLKRILSLRLLLFVIAYAVFFLVSFIQLKAGDFLLQESGELDSVTSYDYVLPVINSVATVVTLVAFTLAGFFAYNKDKVKMLRFPMAYCISSAAGVTASNLFMAIHATPLFNLNSFKPLSFVAVAVKLICAFIFFLYFDSEKDDEYYYSDEYYVENPSSRSLRDKILSHRFSVFFVVLIISVGVEISNGLIRSGLTAAIMLVPDDFIWISNYIEAVTDIITYALYALSAWYFSREIRTTLKFIGLIFFVAEAMNGFSFVINSITNAFSQAGEHLLNSIFSTVFVSVAAFIISVIRLIVLVAICSRLKKSKEAREYY